MEKLCCKVCGRSFPSPRSLVIHMRSHVLVKSEEEAMCKYGFRENPRRSWRLKEKEKDMLGAKCGEGFNSWSSLFKHANCHSEMIRDDVSAADDEEFEKMEKDLKSNEGYEEEEDEMKRRSDREVNAAVFPAMERRKRSRSPDLSLEYENEQKVAAICLMLLSRGAGFDTDSSDKDSAGIEEAAEKKISHSGFPKFDLGMNERKKDQSFPKFDLGMNERKKFRSFPPESEFSHKLKKSKASSNKKDLNFAISELRKRSRFKCSICSKSFHSYQALGGHMASHKKIKVGSFSEIPATEELNIQNHGSKSTEHCFKCSICGRIFASGQALGGHKRSHLVQAKNAASASAVQASPTVTEIEQKNHMLGPLDLNLPALHDEIYSDNPKKNTEYCV